MRVWKNTAQDDGSIHSLGNGRIMAYAQGPDWIQVFGPPYSSPTQMTLRLAMDAPLQVNSQREPFTAIWNHEVVLQGEPAGTIQDFCDSEAPLLVRRFFLSAPLRFLLNPAPLVKLISVLPDSGGGYLLETPSGAFFYHTYPIPQPLFTRILFRGNVTIRNRNTAEVEITCLPGESTIFVCGGPAYPEAAQTAASVQDTPVSSFLERTRKYWQQGSSPHQTIISMLPDSVPSLPALAQAVDDTALLIQTQQDASGGVLAGHNYHLAYVRDQYGVSRGLLALGHTASARRILNFYWQIWQHYGRIHNAQAAGLEGAFHVHEFDGSEITGYLIHQAFDLLEKDGDREFTRRIFPMLEWAFEAQANLLVEDMLPFNGDETYIAGGILPRSAINDGSAEATLLFIESGRKLLAFAQAMQLWPSDRLHNARATLEQVSAHFRGNFMPQGRLLTNNPARSQAAPLPAFRHGVCERCHAEGRAVGIEWTARNQAGRYICPACLALGDFPAVPPRIYELQSVSLSPFYLHSRLLSKEELAPNVNNLAGLFSRTGRLPSRPDDPDGITVGYDYGLFLNALTDIHHPLASEIYKLTLDRADSSGAWVEYYRSGQPSGTRCRPWESGINIEALLKTTGL